VRCGCQVRFGEVHPEAGQEGGGRAADAPEQEHITS
jgi:hypothetical protein